MVTRYDYDQLHRLKYAIKLGGINENTWTFAPPTVTYQYAEEYKYDANGNILNLGRREATATIMDNLTYEYYPSSNKIKRVTDLVPAASFATDIDTQTDPENYLYDGAGNLMQDKSENLTVSWTAYGKVNDLTLLSF